MEERYHTCRWCRHYDDGKCLKSNVSVVAYEGKREIEPDEVEIYINDPNYFYCKEWA